MKKFFKKIKNKAGESLVETLAAILIAALSSAALAMGIMTSTRAETKITAMQTEIEAQVSEAERCDGEEEKEILLYMINSIEDGQKIALKNQDGSPMKDGDKVLFDEQLYSLYITGGTDEITSFKLKLPEKADGEKDDE